MAIVRELVSGDQRLEGPGIYLLPDQRQFGLKPMRSEKGLELVPFSWVSEWPPLERFIDNFPDYWTRHAQAEHWTGGLFTSAGIYWVMYSPKELVRTREGLE